MVRRVAITIMVLWALLATINASASNTVRLEYDLTPGSVVKHRLTADIQMTSQTTGNTGGTTPMKLELTGLIRARVLERLPNGTVKVSVSMEQMKLGAPGSDAPMEFPIQTTVAIVDKHGRLVRYEEGRRNTLHTAFSAGEVGAFIPFPAKLLKIGDNWTNRHEMPGKDAHVQVQNRLVNRALPVGSNVVSRVSHRFTGRLDMSEAGPPLALLMGQVGAGGTGRISGSGTTDFSPSKGKLIRSEVNLDLTVQPETGPTTRTKLRAVLQAI